MRTPIIKILELIFSRMVSAAPRVDLPIKDDSYWKPRWMKLGWQGIQLVWQTENQTGS